MGGLAGTQGKLRSALEQVGDQLPRLAREVQESGIASGGMSELAERISRTQTALQNWLDVDDAIANEDFPDAQVLQDRMRIALARWPLAGEVPEQLGVRLQDRALREQIHRVIEVRPLGAVAAIDVAQVATPPRRVQQQDARASTQGRTFRTARENAIRGGRQLPWDAGARVGYDARIARPRQDRSPHTASSAGSTGAPAWRREASTTSPLRSNQSTSASAIQRWPSAVGWMYS